MTAVEMALFKNSMIVLPTGFGKTFIAAVVMYNFYRWYPTGKIIFVAPTRPLVTQQIHECKKISGIPSSDCVELTGSIGREKRVHLWETKRVFFATPQVIENDLDNQILPAKQVKCLVIDEAHKAQGSYAYVGIVRQLQEYNKNGYRILALSATPGSDIQRVQQIMMNLYINDVMFRSERSIDLMQFKNDKHSKAWTVELTGKHKQFVDKFITITKPLFKELCRAGLTYGKDSIECVAKYTLIMASQNAYRNEVSSAGVSKGRLRYICAAAASLSSKFELLVLYGIRVFYSSITRTLNEPKSTIRTALASSVEFDVMMEEIRQIFGDDIEPDASKIATADLLLGHPKLRVLKDLLMKHFNGHADQAQTRAIVFTKYRESVYDIVQTLKAYDPVLKPGAFVGQGAASKTGAGMKQKEQIQMVKDFKEGKYNVLVATCVAEEGLDIGEVDMIICYDTTSSPISNTQRGGRTGRKRAGDVQTLLTKGYEEGRLKKAGNSKRQVEEQLFNRENYMSFRYRDNPRMVPEGIVPACLQQKIFPVNDEPEEETKPKRKRQKKATVVEIDVDDDLKKMKKRKKDDLEVEEVLIEDDNEDEFDSVETSFTTTTITTAATTPTLTQQTDSGVTEAEGDASDLEWGSDLEYNCV